jgi:hypothetical protein
VALLGFSILPRAMPDELRSTGARFDQRHAAILLRRPQVVLPVTVRQQLRHGDGAKSAGKAGYGPAVRWAGISGTAWARNRGVSDPPWMAVGRSTGLERGVAHVPIPLLTRGEGAVGRHNTPPRGPECPEGLSPSLAATSSDSARATTPSITTSTPTTRGPGKGEHSILACVPPGVPPSACCSGRANQG